MAEVVIPEIKHEYIRQVDTETTKNDWFDECIADNKEAAWAGIGTSENDSQYQPAPSVEPDYYMQYCSSDDYDYLKDYRLIWGYGIGIIEQDVICSLSTGEHLAEGKDACDTYATENAAGQDTDWKRGTWIKFSGNRNVSPTRIGEVTLPDRVISLKDLCAALTLENPCDFYLPQENGILNAQNLCGTKTNSTITLCLSEDAGMPFANALNLSYAFAYTDARIWQFNTYAIDESYMFYHAKVGQLAIASMDSSCNYTSKFEEATGDGTTMITVSCLDKAMFKNSNNFIIDTTVTSICKQDVSECFYGCDIYMNITGIDFSEARNVQYMFYNINIVDADEIDLDLSSFIEHEDDVENRFTNFFLTFNNITVINIIAPSCKLKGRTVFRFYDNIVNITNELKCYDLWDNETTCKYYRGNAGEHSYAFIYGYGNVINGTIIGINIFEYYGEDNILVDGSNVTIKTSTRPDNINIKDIYERYKNSFFPCIFIQRNKQNITNISNYINIDDYYPVNSIISVDPGYDVNINNTIEKTINKIDKEFCIITRRLQGIWFDVQCNENSICSIGMNYGDENNDYGNVNNISSTHYDYVKITNSNNTKIEIPIYACGYEYNASDSFDMYSFYNCRLIINNDTEQCNMQFSAIDELYIANLDRQNNINDYMQFNFYGNKINKLINNYSNCYTTSGTGVNYSSKLMFNIREIDNIETEIETNFPICHFRRRNNETDELIEYPNIKDVDNFTLLGVIGEFKNTPLSHLNKRYYRYGNSSNTRSVSLYYEEEYINDLTDFDFNYNTTLKDFSVYGDYTDKILRFRSITNGSSIGYTITNTNNKLNNLTTEINGVGCSYYNVTGNLTINCPDTYNTSINIKGDSYNDIDTLTINLNNRGFASGFGITFDSDLTNIDNIYINTNGGKIYTDTNYKNFSNLSQESINSIVNPNIYNSGIIITIHTTPFQYITEEQKQALVDAGITLVEYIPTETTE